MIKNPEFARKRDKTSASATGDDQDIGRNNSHHPPILILTGDTAEDTTMAGNSGGGGKYRIPKVGSGSTRDQGGTNNSGKGKTGGPGGSGQGSGKGSNQTAGGKGKGQGKGNRDRRGERSGKTASLPVVPASLRDTWIKEKRCLACGSENHFVRECPVPTPKDNKTNKQGNAQDGQPTQPSGKGSSQKSSAEAKQAGGESKSSSSATASSGPSTSSGRGAKRSRDPTHTGVTPPAKKPLRQKFSYAAIAAGVAEMVIVTQDRTHISNKDFQKLRDAVEDRFIAMLNEGVVPLAVDKWSYSSTMATISIADSASVKEVERIVEASQFLLATKEDIENERKPTTVLTGLVTGSAARRSKEELERFIKAEKARLAIPGRLDFNSTLPIAKSGNLLLRIRVDDEAKERLSEVNNQLRIGASGQVKFEDERKKVVVNQQTRQERIRDLEKRIADEQEKIRQLCIERRDLEKAETESVGSMGMGTLHMETDDPTSEEIERLFNADKAAKRNESKDE